MRRNGRLKRGVEIKGQELQCYAPGNGSLHFVWTTMEHPYTATGRQVKRWHVLRYLQLKDGRRLVQQGWKLYNIHGQWQLVKTVKRRNKNTLQIDENCFTYEVKPLSPREGKEVWDCDLTVWAKTDPNSLARKAYGPKYEIKNMSIRAEIRYFLTHEEKLKVG